MNQSADLASYATLSPKSFAKFAEFITNELGIKMPTEKLPMLQSRLQRRLRQLHLETLEQYQERLFNSPDSESERIEFINLVTTNKTDFLREPSHFAYLSHLAVPLLAPHSSVPWHFKLWCAGCSSGEEAYTLAMVLSEFQLLHPGFDFSILGTDISTRVLEHAVEAVYDESRVEPVPMDWRRRYLLRSKDRQHPLVRIAPEIRHKVRFSRLNFMDADYGIQEQFDTIFFRNVMIYFDKPTQHAVLQKLCRQLRPGGYLFVGHSESLVGANLPLESVATSVFKRL